MLQPRERQQFLDLLAARGARVTRERMALFDEIFTHHGHIDAEELLERMRRTGAKISRATVYRNLDLLVDCGLVHKHRLGRNRYLYEHVHGGQRHDHLVCTGCGRVVEFVSPGIEALQTEICRAHGFDPATHTLQISSVCRECREGANGLRGRSQPRSSPRAWLTGGLLALALGGAAVAGCRGEAPLAADAPAAEEQILLILSEREEEVVGDLLAAWSAATGFEVEVRYGAPGELAAAALAEEPPAQPTLFLSRDAATLGALAAAGRALPLPADLVAAVDPLFADAERRWVGLTGRARVVVHDPGRVPRGELPADLAAFGDPAYRGRFGLAPGSRSFRVHLAAWRALHGAEALDRLLARLAENEPVVAADGAELVAAVLDGEADLALVDQDDLFRVRAARAGVEGAEAAGAEAGTAGKAAGETSGPPDAAAGAAVPLPAADSSGYLDLAGAAVLAESPAALALLRHLLGPDAQLRFAAATFEYPLLRGVEPPLPLLPLAALDLAQIDYRAVAAALPATEEAIDASPLAP